MAEPERHRRALPAVIYLAPLADPDAAHAPRFSITHPYIEQCWLPILGPSTVWCLRHLGAELDAHPDGTAVDLAQLARGLGVGADLGPRSLLARTIDRLGDFHLARFSEQDTLALRTVLPPIGERSLARLPEDAQAAHRRMVAAARHELEAHAAERGIGNPLLVAALDYAAHDLAVLPLRPNDKAPHGLLVPHGLRDATTDPERILEWWLREPGANVGIRTGSTPYGRGLDVIDLDSEEATQSFAERAPEPVTPGLLVRTARGWHLWFASSELPSRTALAEGIDVRGEGGYVVAPPSLHPSGATYRLVDPDTGAILDRLPKEALAPVPEWLASWCRPEPHATGVDGDVTRLPIRLSTEHYVAVAVERECSAVASTPEGARNHRLNRAAFSLGTLVGADLLDAEAARAHLLDAARRAGLEERESLRTIASGLSAGKLQPRQRLDPPERDGAPTRGPKRAPTKGRPPDPSGRPVDRAEADVVARAQRNRAEGRPAPHSPTPAAPLRAVPQRELGR